LPLFKEGGREIGGVGEREEEVEREGRECAPKRESARARESV
jgi:hypothetical protein